MNVNLFEQQAKAQVRANIHTSQRQSLADIDNFITTASLRDCRHIVNSLTERVSDLSGCAVGLEDAACQLTAEIECEENGRAA